MDKGLESQKNQVHLKDTLGRGMPSLSELPTAMLAPSSLSLSLKCQLNGILSKKRGIISMLSSNWNNGDAPPPLNYLLSIIQVC